MLQTQSEAPPSNSLISDYSPSQSPQIQINSAPQIKINSTINDIDSTSNDEPPQQLSNTFNNKNLTLPANDTNQDPQSHDEEESLHDMVQSILNDSDNDQILNNLNGLGYNNIQYTNKSPPASISSSPQPTDTIKSKSAPSLHNIIPTPSTHNNIPTPSTPSTQPSKRKYVIEWRTLIFIRHGKSKWNAAEGNTVGKVVAAGQGLWEYYKNKKLREKNIVKQKSDVDIMDASLSREGIMEALQLSVYLRQYTVNNQLNTYNNLFEQTRNKIMNIINETNGNKAQLKECLQMLDKYKIESLVQQHPPQDDDNLRLPQPVPYNNNKLSDINENDTIISMASPPPIDEQVSNENEPSVSVSYQSLNDFNIEETKINNVITKGNKKYMQSIGDPLNKMSAEYITNLLNGNESKCGIVVSNLRRAMSTACICLKDRLQRRPYEKIQILGCLQEIGLNSDTRPLLFTANHKPNLAKTEKTSPLLSDHNMNELYSERLSTKYYKGDASDKTAQQRLQEFALWLFAQRKYLHVITIGHSHWFQSFFKAYLPADINENELPAKVRTKKIKNCGVVAFRIMKKYVPSKSKRHGRHISFEIAPNSITTVKFSLYNKPTTNWDVKDEELDVEEEEEKEMGLEQSTSTIATSLTGILASIQPPQDNGKTYDDFLNVNMNEKDKEISEEKKEEIIKENKEKKSNGYLSNLSKPKNWMSRAIGRFGGGSSPNTTNGNVSENGSNEKEHKKDENNKLENGKEETQQLTWDDIGDIGNGNGNVENETNDIAVSVQNMLNAENETNISVTDDEDYIS